MDIVCHPAPLSGALPAISSKSMAHRLLILAALSSRTTDVHCSTASMDIEATAGCLRALGARVTRTQVGYRVVPVPDGARRAPGRALVDCGESGSTLRFIVPVACALGEPAEVVGHGRLADRPLEPLLSELRAHGAKVSEQGRFPLEVSGPLAPGRFLLPGDVSSQFVSGLLLAAPLLGGPVEVAVTEPVESLPYVDLTKSALAAFGVGVSRRHEEEGGRGLTVFSLAPTGDRPASPGLCEVEGDWSNAAFWLAAGALSEGGVAVTGLDLSSAQGDRSILAALSCFGARVARKGGAARATRDRPRATTLDVSDFPDLVPPLAAVAALSPGTTRLTHAGRLRLKESDRLETVSAARGGPGAGVRPEGDDLVVVGREALLGGEVDSANDHRIAMMAAVAATRATGDVTIHGAECVSKSYPAFFEDYELLGGSVTRKGDDHAL
jgi:3-phosphoshikimate 1-carboxyvinyltransferase